MNLKKTADKSAKKYESTPLQEVKDDSSLDKAVLQAFQQVCSCIEKIYNYYSFYCKVDDQAQDTANFAREAERILTAQHKNCKAVIDGEPAVATSGLVNNLIVACSVRELDSKFKGLANYKSIMQRDYIGNSANAVKQYADEYEQCINTLNTINQQAGVTYKQLREQEQTKTGGLGPNIGDSKVSDTLSPKGKNPKKIADKSANRMQHWIDEGYDVAFITAWRQAIDDVTPNTKEVEDGQWEDKPIKLDFAENQKRNKELVALLRSFGYGVTTNEGYFDETGEGQFSKERSLFVVNLKGDKKFKSILMNVSEYYNQYSFILKEGDSDKFIEYFTNTCDGHKVGEVGMKFESSHISGNDYEYAYTRVKNKKMVLDPVKDSNMNWGFAEALHNYAVAKKPIDRIRGLIAKGIIK